MAEGLEKQTENLLLIERPSQFIKVNSSLTFPWSEAFIKRSFKPIL